MKSKNLTSVSLLFLVAILVPVTKSSAQISIQDVLDPAHVVDTLSFCTFAFVQAPSFLPPCYLGESLDFGVSNCEQLHDSE